MEKTLKTMLAIVAAVATVSACQRENIIEEGDAGHTVSVLKPMSFSAYMEGQNPVSKATIDGSLYATNQLYDIKWVVGDKISVFDEATENNGNQEFTLDAGAATTSGTFIGEAAEADTYYAIYPYSLSKNFVPTMDDIRDMVGDEIFNEEIKEHVERFDFAQAMELEPSAWDWLMGLLGVSSQEDQELIRAYYENRPFVSGAQREGDSFSNVIVPSEQAVSDGQFVDPKAMLMIAKSSDASVLPFKNICAYIRVTPQFDCSAIGIKSNGNQNIAGTVTVCYNDGNPTATVTANGTNEVFLTGTIKAGKSYYIAVLPAVLSSGFSIQFLAKDSDRNLYTRSTLNSMTLSRNNVTNLGSFETTGVWASILATTGDDGNGHSWKLITPTLKLATKIATLKIEDTYIDALWGDDWWLPSPEDMQSVAEGKGYSTGCIFGVGILRYAEPRAINVSYFWLVGKKVFDTSTGTIHESYDDFAPLLYKYIKTGK